MADRNHTLCWDCGLSTTGECRWSRRLKPVKGWEAEERKDGWFVISCPLFRRDSWGAGRFKTEKEYLAYTKQSKKNEETKKMNKLTIIGNLTSDPELRTIPSTGKSVCTFGVAVNRRNKPDNQDADFFRVSAWDQLGNNCSKYLAKGRKVCVIGPVSVHTYTSKNGETKASLEVTAQDVEFLSPRSETVDQQTGFTKANVDELPWE